MGPSSEGPWSPMTHLPPTFPDGPVDRWWRSIEVRTRCARGVETGPCSRILEVWSSLEELETCSWFFVGRWRSTRIHPVMTVFHPVFHPNPVFSSEQDFGLALEQPIPLWAPGLDGQVAGGSAGWCLQGRLSVCWLKKVHKKSL